MAVLSPPDVVLVDLGTTDLTAVAVARRAYTAGAVMVHCLTVGPTISIEELVATSNRISFADLRELKALPPEKPKERRRIAPVLGPPPFNPRNAGMDIRRFTPRRT